MVLGVFPFDAHDEPDAYAAGEHYFPDGLAERAWYQPAPRGLETQIAEKLNRLQDLDADAREAARRAKGGSSKN